MNMDEEGNMWWIAHQNDLPHERDAKREVCGSTARCSFGTDEFHEGRRCQPITMRFLVIRVDSEM